MQKITTLLTLFLFSTFTLPAQTNGWMWAKSTGLSQGDAAYGMATDKAANAYAVGTIYTTSYDGLITKTNSAGTTAWSKLIVGSGTEKCKNVAVDKNKNVYVAGVFDSPTLIFGTDTLFHTGNKDIFLVKYDSLGVVQWATSPIGNPTTDEEPDGICLDTAGNVVMAGSYGYDQLVFGTYTLTTPGIYLAKYDPSGNVLWAKSTNYGGGIASGVTCDGNNHISITGMYGEATIAFGSHSLNNSDPWGGSWDILVYNFDENGNALWGNTAGAFQAYESGQAIAADSAGNVYVTGGFQSPGISFGSFSLNNNGAAEYFIVKYDPTGNVLWAQSAGGSNWDGGQALAVDKQGNAYVGGNFSTNITLGMFTLSNASPGSYDMFLAKYDPSGYVLWAKKAGGTNSDMVNAVAVCDARNIYAGGGFVSTTMAFGSTTLTNSGSSDVFFAKYSPCSDNNYVPICMVTVDSMSMNNIIYWDKTNLTSSVDSFIIYREVQTNMYLPIGAVPFDSMSLFVDTARTKYFATYFNTGDPNSGTYRYKIAIRDTCGNISQMSGYHNTIFMINNNGTFSWPQLYNIENTANPVGSYVLYRDDFNTGNWHGVNSVTGSQQTITDPNYQAFQSTANWQIRTMWSIACTPTQRYADPNEVEGAVVKSKSNITNNRVNTVGQVKNTRPVFVYPNPSNGLINLRSDAELGAISIYNTLGELVYQTSSKEKQVQIDLGKNVTGIYLVNVQGQHLKIIKE